MASPRDDRLKLYTTMTLLQFRRANREVFQSGGYEALAAEGPRREHLFAFARTHAQRHIVVVVPRLLATLLPDPEVPPLGERVWGDTRVAVPPSAGYRQVFTSRCVTVHRDGDRASVSAAEIFEHFPVAVLESVH